MRQSYLWALFIVLAIAASLSTVFLPSRQAPQEVVEVGLILPLTGPAASIGELFKSSMEWKAEQLRAEGLLIQLHIEDTASDPKRAVTGFQKLFAVDGVRLFYTTTSAAAVALLPGFRLVRRAFSGD